MKLHTILVICTLFAATPLAAQAPEKQGSKATRLEQLITELRGLDGKQWSARLGQLDKLAKAHEAEAAQQRKKSAELLQQAAASDSRAKAVRAEIAQLGQLQQLIGALTTTTATPAAKTKPNKAMPLRKAQIPATARHLGSTKK